MPRQLAGLSRRRFLTAALASLPLAISGSPVDPTARHLYINTAFGPPLGGPDGLFARLMRLVFDGLGYSFTLQAPPAERALMLANAGIDDGDGPRISGLTEEYPHLVRVPEPVLVLDFVAFTKRLRFSTETWASLAPFSVAIVTGWKILERNITHSAGLVRVKEPERLFMLLKEGRTEVVVIDRFSGYATCRKVRLAEFNVLDPPLASAPMYLYLHERHAQLIPAISSALRDLKAAGTYERVLQETLTDVHGYATVPHG